MVNFDAINQSIAELSSSLGLRLKRSKPSRVFPARQTMAEGDGVYFLCNLDQNVALTMNTVNLYLACEARGAEDPAVVLRKSLEEVLVYYYPLSGKLALSKDAKLQVVCSDEGVPFVEAEVDAAISDLGENPQSLYGFMKMLVCAEPPDAMSPLDIPLFTVQVTRFKCGGFSVGMSMNHCMADGVSAGQFLISWGEVARGLPVSLPPVLDRSILRARDPLKIEFAHLEFSEVQDLSPGLVKDPNCEQHHPQEIVFSSFSFDSQALAAMKQQILNEGELNRCTNFTVLTAFIWRARTQALGMASTHKTKLLFAVDGSSKLQPPLPKGFFGNGIVLTCAVTSAGDLTSRNLSYAVELVQNAIDIVDDAFIRSTIDYFEKTRARPSLSSTLIITSWCTLPFCKADFGWGQSQALIPAGAPQPEVVFFLDHPRSGRGIKVLLGLPPPAMAKIQELIQQQLRI